VGSDRVEEFESIQEVGVSIREGAREEGGEEGDVVLHNSPGVELVVTVEEGAEG
jgi:hypothetical protein